MGSTRPLSTPRQSADGETAVVVPDLPLLLLHLFRKLAVIWSILLGGPGGQLAAELAAGWSVSVSLGRQLALSGSISLVGQLAVIGVRTGV